jgi:low affinity Fe/Cu permease
MQIWFTRLATATSRWTGRPITFALCLAIVISWGLTGPLFHYSDTWQLVINTSTTIVTFLMVFLIQNTQNRDSAALQTKIDELIRTSSGARNAFIGIEHLTEEDLDRLRVDLEQLAHAHDDHEAIPHLRRSFERASNQKRKHRASAPTPT